MFWKKDRGWKPSKEQIERLEQLADDWTQLARALRALSERMDTLEDKFSSLRGLVYAKKLHREAKDEPPEPLNGSPPPTMSRADLKAWLTRTGRFVPGKPAVHNEE